MVELQTQYDNQMLAREVVARTVMGTFQPKCCSDQPSALALKIAHKNAVGLPFSEHYPKDIELLATERRRFSAFNRVMHETSELLQARGIEHIYIKFRKHYPYYDSNVDVIVKDRAWRQTIGLLQDEGYRSHVMFKEPDKIMFSKPGSSISIHLHPGVTWNGVSYLDTQALWQQSIPAPDGPWLELAYEHDFLVNLAHNMFENYEVILGDILYFKRFLKTHVLDPVRLEGIAGENGWSYGFREAYSHVQGLVEAWAFAEQTDDIPVSLLLYPYRIPLSVLMRAFGQRVICNISGQQFRAALRELYAYPTFYALKRRHDFAWFAK